MNKQEILVHLFEIYKFTHKESERLDEQGVSISSFQEIYEKVYDTIREVVGMPQNIVDDFIIGSLVKYVDDQITLEEVIWKFISWRNTYKDLPTFDH